jgi:hypothetical protein
MTTPKINGDQVEYHSVDVFYDRPYRTMWNRYGEPHEMPADSSNLIDLLSSGWTIYEPPNPQPKPTAKLMRDGSIYDFGTSARDVSSVEQARMDRNPSVSTGAVTPTATYYSEQGDKFEGWPADPESIRQYQELGFSLRPPARSPGRPRKRS